MAKEYDVIIVGAGPAGMTAATYLSRANLSVLLIDKGLAGGQLNNTNEVENYTGFSSINGPDLAQKMYESSMQFGAEYLFADVQSVEVNKGEDGQIISQTIKTEADEFTSRALVIATGTTNAKLGLESEAKYTGHGVSYCAVCDGNFFKQEPVVVVGGGDSAVQEAIYLANLASKVTVVARGNKLRAQPIFTNKASQLNNIEFIYNSNVKEIIGDEKNQTGVKIENKTNRSQTTIDANGTFIYVGLIPNTKEFSNLNILDENGWVITNDKMETNIPGIYAIGDVRQNSIRQIASAVGEGAIIGQEVFEYLSQKSSINYADHKDTQSVDTKQNIQEVS